MSVELGGAYLDGELSDHRRAELDAHLDDCACCRAELDEVRALWALLDRDRDALMAPSEAPSASLKVAVLTRVRDAAPRAAPSGAGRSGQTEAWRPGWLVWLDRLLSPRWLAPVLGAAATAGVVALLATAPTPPSGQLDASLEIAMARDLELLEDYEVLVHLEALEDIEVVAALPELEAAEEARP